MALRVTHYGHACLLVENSQSRFVFDPGIFSSGLEHVADVSAIFVTHQHPDHVDQALLRGLLQRSPSAALVIDAGSLDSVRPVTDGFRVAQPGERFTLAGTEVAVIGGNHAVVHPDVPGIPNVGYLLDDGACYHPGDAFDIPPQDIDVLALPIAAPWLKAAEVVEYLRAVAPRVAIPIHEAVLAKPEWQFPLYQSLTPDGTTFWPLERAVSADV